MMTLNEAIEYYDSLAEECRKKASIERNDYMDLRDESAEYSQLSEWLAELAVLREKVNCLESPNSSDDCISRQAAIDAIEFGITCAKVICKETGEVKDLFQESNNELIKAAERVKQLPSVQPEIIHCRDCMNYNAGYECLIEGYGIERDENYFCGSAERRTD